MHGTRMICDTTFPNMLIVYDVDILESVIFILEMKTDFYPFLCLESTRVSMES